MNSNQRNLPRTSEEKTIIDSAHRDARKGGLIGAVAGGAAGGLLSKKKRKLYVAATGALAGGAVGHDAGRAIGVRRGARDVTSARKALREMTARIDRLTELADARDNAGDDWYQDRVAQARLEVRKKYGPAMERAMSDEQILAAVERRADDSGNSFLPGAFHRADDVTRFDTWMATSAISRDANGNLLEGQSRQHPVRVYPKVRKPYSVDGVDYQGEYELTPSRLALIEKYGIGIVTAIPEDQLTEEACKRLADAFLAKMRRANSPGGGVRSGEDFERRVLAQHMGGHAVESMGPAEVHAHYMGAVRRGLVELADDTDTTDFDLRVRNAQGEYSPGEISSSAVQRAYHRSNKERKTGVSTGTAAGSAAVLAGAILAHKKLKRARVPKLGPGVPKLETFARSMPQSPFGTGPLRLVRRPRRGGKLLKAPVPMLPTSNFGSGNLAGGLVEGAIDALGLGGATNPKKRKVLVDRNGNPLNPNFLPDPGTTSTSSFSAVGKLGGVAARYLPDALTIGAADLTAQELHDALTKARAKKKQRQNIRGGIEATPGLAGATQTMGAILETIQEFEHGKERVDRAKRNGATIAASGAGAVGGALAGAYHDQGKPVRVRDLRPGDQVYRRQGIGGIYQHTGVVDEDGRVAHRSRGASVARSVKPESFIKGGRGPLRRESHADDLPRGQAARNASRAAGQRQGKYSLVGENCQTASSRIASKSAPGSRQLRKVIGGAAAGAVGAGALVKILQNRRKQQ